MYIHICTTDMAAGVRDEIKYVNLERIPITFTIMIMMMIMFICIIMMIRCLCYNICI